MSDLIHGFEVDGVIKKYDYESLENKPDIETEISDAVDAAVAGVTATVVSTTTDWLNANVTPTGSAVTVDSSLSVAGSAADAKKTGDELSDLKSDIAELEKNTVLAIVNTTSGDIASFSDGADDYPVKDLVAHIEPVQSGSGDPSPDNVRPITGRTGANVTRTGKNLFSSEIVHGIWASGVFYPHEGNASKYLTTATKIKVKPNKTYCVSFKDDTNNAVANLAYNSFDINGVFLDNTVVSIETKTFTTGSNVHFVVINFVLTSDFTTVSEVTTTDFQLELGSTATDYEPYNGDTYAVTFPTEAGTVYGGTLDVTTGVLTVDRKLYTFTGNEYFGKVTSTQNYFRWYSTDFINTIPDWKIPNVIKLSNYPPTITNYWDGGADTNKSAWTVRSAAGVCFRNDDFSTASEFADSLVGQGMLYELAEPVTYQLTPIEVKTLLGANNIYADTGAVDVEYCADTKKYIDNKIAELQALIL